MKRRPHSRPHTLAPLKMASTPADPPTTPPPPPKVDLGDWAAVKRALDDATAAAVLARGYAEDGTVYWCKLGLGLARWG